MNKQDLFAALAESGPLAKDSFAEPWMARAFALTIALAERSQFTLKDFQAALINTIGEHEKTGCIAEEEAYYTCWLAALDALLQERRLTSDEKIKVLETSIVAEAAARKEHQHQVSRDADGNLKIGPAAIA